jgi:hypothetical protein
LGYNPLEVMGVAEGQSGEFYLCEYVGSNGQWSWQWYGDYTKSVPLPGFIKVALPKFQPMVLARRTFVYDFALQQGHKNIGGWIDLAATEAGR